MDHLTPEEERLLDAAEESLAKGTPLPTCPDCESIMSLKSRKWMELATETSDGQYYECINRGCRATHSADSSGRPLGVPGDRETRKARRQAHEAIDILWQRRWVRKRADAYRMIASHMGLNYERLRIASFSKDQCWALIDCVDAFLEKRLAVYAKIGEQARFWSQI